jgi:uncharacterized protein
MRISMMLNRSLRCAALALSFALVAPAFAADEPSMHQVYVAADAGKFSEAQAMMDVVLRAHPDSGKAHFVEAELLAKQGRMSEAQAELSTAERLKPGLPFATPSAVRNLRAHIAGARPDMRAATPVQAYAAVPQYSRPASSGMPWGLIIVAGALVVLVVWIARRRNAQMAAPGAMQSYGGAAPMSSYGPGGQMMPGSGGMGSGILGGLATGAAVGAGIVAGEALMHHFTDSDRNDRGYVPPPAPSIPDDMGGNDFGVSDSGSWDDGGGGGDDWN